MRPKVNHDLMREFKRGLEPPKEEKKKKSLYVPPKSQRQGGSTPYENFLKKYNDLENHIDSFKTRDLAYFYREVSEESGHRYVMSNIKKDMAIFKRLQENFTSREICCMIEFLYLSEQDYLDKDRLSPNLLASQWVNTIYADMKLWVDDKYAPKSKKKHQNREWSAPVDETSSSSKIGEWD